MSVGHACALTGRRLCALLAVCSAGLHVVMLGHAGSPALAVLVLAMLSVCLFCAWELWRDSSLRAWTLVALMNLGMVAVHLGGLGHHHGAPLPLASASAPSALIVVATAIAFIEVAAGVVVLFYRTRDRATTLGPLPPGPLSPAPSSPPRRPV